MPLRQWLERAGELAGAPGFRAIEANRDEWWQAAQEIGAAGGRLLALWATPADTAGTGADVYAAFLVQEHAFVVGLTLASSSQRYHGLQELFPVAARMQRAAFDLAGVRSTNADSRPWLRHAGWPSEFYPLHGASAAQTPQLEIDAYAFVRVEGEGVHEIAVGPVHAGIIEPGHFRFSVVGEKVLRLEERLGYVHKGIERRFTELPILEGYRLAARVSGDSAVAFSWAYCQALEGMSGREISPRAAWLRALFLEIERIANHLGDLGALGNDAGFAFGLAQFSRLKESLLRATEGAFGQRYLLDAIVPGGVSKDLAPEAGAVMQECVSRVAAKAVELRDIYDNHAGVRDRFVAAGHVAPELAARLGLIGFAGRASGQSFDARVDLPCAPYAELAPAKVVRTDGDVAARVAVRFDELQESCRLVQRIVQILPDGQTRVAIAAPPANSFGAGLIEGWRGPVFIALEAGAAGTIRRCHPHDPSWQNWPVLEHAIVDNIVPDFPLINKSFNLSYSGHDL
ncbi:MAG TPA: Ni,Fe-hydrogenase III large subunit [Gammaproteobacteria bacterium]|nr:Ni,Fe-hydrogenase III large subunit [Gammaproteobacteria bacterium]